MLNHGAVDNMLPNSIFHTVDTALNISMKVGAIVIISPIFSVPAVITLLVGGWIGHVFMRAQLPVKREGSKAKAPVLGHFDSAVGGLGLC